MHGMRVQSDFASAMSPYTKRELLLIENKSERCDGIGKRKGDLSVLYFY